MSESSDERIRRKLREMHDGMKNLREAFIRLEESARTAAHDMPLGFERLTTYLHYGAPRK